MMYGLNSLAIVMALSSRFFFVRQSWLEYQHITVLLLTSLMTPLIVERDSAEVPT